MAPEAGVSPPARPASGAATGGSARRAMARTFRAFAAARVFLGLLLLGLHVALAIYTHAPVLSARFWVLGAQAALAAGTLLWTGGSPRADGGLRAGPIGPSGRLRRRWALASIGVDVLAFSALLFLPGESGNGAALFTLPLLMAAVLLPRRLALAVASAVVLVLLGDAFWSARDVGDVAALVGQAGITGAGMLVMVVLSGELAERLARQELANRTTLQLARQQALLNRLMIEEMHDGVMVVDRHGAVRSANPAALSLIGAPAPDGFVPFDLMQRPDWAPLRHALRRVYASGQCPEAGEELALDLTDGRRIDRRHLRLRMRFTRRMGPEDGEMLCLLLVDDVRMLRSRARQERLAAMGRMSAGIAHEIRNPLAAIAQANELLSEDLQDPAQQRLTRMVADNVRRLKRIVDDVMQAAPGEGGAAPVIDLAAQCRRLCEDWMRTNAVATDAAEGSPVLLDVGRQPQPVRFEIDHLRRLLVNLLDNAWRHGSGRTHAIWVRVAELSAEEIQLSVASDGEPIPPDVEPHLFEPFFSTRSRGSGLGLYICRELCERHGATIEYRSLGSGARHRNVFSATLPKAAQPAGTPFADTDVSSGLSALDPT